MARDPKRIRAEYRSGDSLGDVCEKQGSACEILCGYSGPGNAAYRQPLLEGIVRECAMPELKRQNRSPRKKRPKKRSASAGKREQVHYWSGRVTRESNALDLGEGVFKLNDPRKIALSLKHSADVSKRRKADPYRSALSMLVFYINRAGKNLPASRKRVLERAKGELKKLFGKA